MMRLRLFALVQVCLICFSAFGIVNAQYSGGQGEGGYRIEIFHSELNGTSLSGPFFGGYASGECGTELAAVTMSGFSHREIYLGQGGDGTFEKSCFGSSLGIEDNATLYHGNNGRGDSESESLSSSLSGEFFHVAFGGGKSRGDEEFSVFNRMLDGQQLNSAYIGNTGHGEFLNVANAEILHCTYYSIWTGTVSTAWETPDNWQCNELPHRYSDVIIPSTAPHFPIITLSPVEIRNLTLDTTSTLHVLGAALHVLGGDQ